MSSAADPVALAIEGSRRDVLDFSFRNPLLSFRPGRRRGVRIVDELSREVFRILVREERVMYFLPGEDTEETRSDAPEELLAILAEPPDDAEPAARHTDNKLQTALSLPNLNLRLRETSRQARLMTEEQGVNFLFLALGTLRWRESDQSEADRCAPLILLPAQLVRSGGRESFKLSWTGEDIEPNLSLETKLRTDFDVRFPGMPAEDELDVETYLTEVERAVESQNGWSVERNDIHLDFFSFNKLLIYKDLDPASWPEGAGPSEHPVARKLFSEAGFREEPPDFEAGGEGTGDVEEAGLHPVVDADSSQALAVLDAMAGRNLVIQGPPGTGKSQTITNLIGEALARGKTILFVAEKMAALEVVKRRLDSVHLGEACLELHSHQTNKRAVLDELKRTLALGCPKTQDTGERRALLEASRERLNDYSEAVGTPVGESRLTPHDLVGRITALRAKGLDPEEAALGIENLASWTAGDFARRRALVREIEALVATIGLPGGHRWWISGRRNFLPSDAPRLRELVASVTASLRRLEEGSEALRGRMGCEERFSALTREDLERLARTARRVREAPDLLGARHRDSEPAGLVAEAARRYAEIREERDRVLIPEAWDQDVLAIRQTLRTVGSKWWRFLSGRFREASRQVGGLCRDTATGAVSEQIELLDAILEARRLRREVAESADLVERLFPGLRLGDRVETYRSFAEAAEWLAALHRDLAEGRIAPEIHALLDDRPDLPELETSAEAADAAREAFGRALGDLEEFLEVRPDRLGDEGPLADRNFGALGGWLQEAHADADSAFDVVRFNQYEHRGAEEGIPEVAALAASSADAARNLTARFEHACYGGWLDIAFRDRLPLAEFDGATHAGVVERFRELDTEQFHENQARIAEQHWKRLPRHEGGGQLGVLKREFQKKSRHLPVRRLMREAGRAIQSIKPVFMMSPLSIAKYIPPGSIRFDLVVFDEASQVRPVDALGAILRGAQTVVVGDSKQLPPTSFFDRMVDEDEEEGSLTADMESILGMFSAQGAPERMLKWHYRSRHESLIAVSNHEFYDDRLIVFPSPDAGKKDAGLLFRQNPENHYERKGINIAEAKGIAQAVMEHARESPGLTLGVAAFSNAQARRIEDEVDILRRKESGGEGFFGAHPEEPFFVKNLENVQGDERDVILISVGYGKVEGTYLPMNFGPLNREGGERRLNVLITRARRRSVVFCNFTGADLDLRRSDARGIAALKTFLEYAETGKLDTPRTTGRGADSPFEEAVADRVRALGFEVEHQVGSVGFFIDLAVRDPRQPGRYLLGIECDGATYHSSRSARDRDRLRQQVLEGLGWTIHRIWSTDWFRDPDTEMKKVEAAIRAASETTGPAPPAPPQRAKPLDRAPEAEREVAVPTRPYEVADLGILILATPLHEAPAARFADWIGKVVAVESPVHEEEVLLRIREATGVGRTGSRIREQMRLGVAEAERSGLCRMDAEGFLWRRESATAEVRVRSGELPPSLRKPERIAKEEIATALIQAARVSYGIEPEAAAREAARLFGFERVTKPVVERFRQVLDGLVADGSLAKEGSLLTIPE